MHYGFHSLHPPYFKISYIFNGIFTYSIFYYIQLYSFVQQIKSDIYKKTASQCYV